MIANIGLDLEKKSKPMLTIMLPFRIKADVSYHTSLQDQGRC
jgi:hypothetical protein